MTVYAPPGTEGSVVSFRARYDNWIGGEFVPPVRGQYFENPSPVNGKVFCEIARSTAEDIELALDAAHAAAPAWGRTSVTDRAVILNKIADRIEANLEMLAVAESWDNGKPVRETLAADLPLVVDHGEVALRSRGCAACEAQRTLALLRHVCHPRFAAAYGAG